jgi:hypothetical protein
MQTAAHPMSMEFIVIIDVGATIILLSEVICPCFCYVQQDHLPAYAAIRPNSNFGGPKNI